MNTNYCDIFKENETIITKRLTLRKFTLDDAQSVYEYGSDEESLKYIAWNGVKTIDEAKENIMNHYWLKPEVYAIELSEIKKCIGCVALRVDESNPEKARFAIIINRSFWGKGYMTETIRKINEFGFSKLGLRKIESGHYIGNEGSGKSMQRCGMEEVCISKRECKEKGKFLDFVNYEITKEKWLQQQANML